MKNKYIKNAFICLIVCGVVGVCSLSVWASFSQKIASKSAPTSQPTSVPAAQNAQDVQMDLFLKNGFSEEDLRSVAPVALGQDSALDSKQAQEFVYDRMLNTRDYYQYVQGSYQRDQLFADNSYTVEYAVQNTDDLKVGEKMVCEGTADISYFSDTNGYRFIVENIAALSDISQNAQMIHSLHYDPEKQNPYDFVSLVRSSSRIQYDEDGISHCYYRAAYPGMVYSRESLDPQEMTMGYLENFDAWKITGTTTVAGRDCWHIEGTLAGEYAEKVQGYRYEMDVDCQTGFVLAYTNYDQNGAVTDQLVTTAITVDQPVTDEVFAKLGGDQTAAYKQANDITE